MKANTSFFERYALQGDDSPRDWDYIWRTVEKVTAKEWEEYRRKLWDAYQEAYEAAIRQTSTERSINSRLAETPETTLPTSSAPGTCSPFGP